MNACDQEPALSTAADQFEAFPGSYILVVDDSRVTRQILGQVLQEAGYSVLFGCDGVESLAILEKYGPTIALVLLDRVMPNLDGLEVLIRMKQHEEWKNIPVIFQTAATSVEEIQTGIAAGAFYYLTKPFREEAVLGIVKATLDDAQQHRTWRGELQGAIQTVQCMTMATFEVRTLREVADLAGYLAKACPHPEQVIGGLGDLLVNAVEHGNLGITFDEKTQLQLEARWEQEIHDRLGREPYASRFATVEFEQTTDWIQITIRDQGAGFDWEPFLEFTPSRVFSTHGRGITMAKSLCFDELEYMGIGNVVVGRIAKTH